jgi:hypothetical protein
MKEFLNISTQISPALVKLKIIFKIVKKKVWEISYFANLSLNGYNTSTIK